MSARFCLSLASNPPVFLLQIRNLGNSAVGGSGSGCIGGLVLQLHCCFLSYATRVHKLVHTD